MTPKTILKTQKKIRLPHNFKNVFQIPQYFEYFVQDFVEKLTRINILFTEIFCFSRYSPKSQEKS